MITNLIVNLIKVYKIFISPQLVFITGTHGCRYRPTCAEVTEEGIRKHGVLHGLRMGLQQFLKCY